MKCMPRDTVVDIVTPTGITVGKKPFPLILQIHSSLSLSSSKKTSPLADAAIFQVIPDTVVVKRCGGACNGRLRCISTQTRNATFYVKTKMGTTVSCSSITVPEDTRCSCGCEKKLDCPGEQYYDQDLCKCTCPVSPD